MTRKRPTALVGIVSALSAAAALAQSNAAAPQPVTEAVTVVAQREPVVTVVAPRETPSEAAAAPRPRTPPAIGKAVDADGDGIADAPAGAARTGTTGRPSGKRSSAAPSAKPGPDCDDKDASATSKAACSQGNPIYKDKAAQGQNPLHVP